MRGNLVNVEPDPEHVTARHEGAAATDGSDASGDATTAGTESAIGFGFEPSSRERRSSLMASDDIWILGIHMTKFGKHPDKDIVDLGRRGGDGRARRRRRDDARHGRARRRQPAWTRARGIGQQLQKQIGQTGIPVYNVANACATGATALRTAIMAVKAGECDMGLAVGVEKLAGAGLLGGGGAARTTPTTWTPQGRYGAVAPVDGRIGTETMPGVFAQVGMEYGHKYGGTSFELFARISEKNHAHSTLNPLAAYTKKMTPRRDHERRHDRLPEHPADVLGQLRRGGRRGRRVRRQAARRCRSSSSAGR